MRRVGLSPLRKDIPGTSAEKGPKGPVKVRPSVERDNGAPM